ncbi:DNA-binding transcriptional regulator, FrmR family [Caloramator fervidus]|uniref:DNA-binding transcriptional regulator, FrmR family n=1 Tax=Caloramator fervidus TaxID=29344 RepID=A0A1H5VZ12_9CLOT|nr:metal-sensitive transcriptional regulator [Caloramator fervidus]SEF92258.1 DNA-binding transcriptional regulator, FrmR family [Caloramator fervidus]
MVECCSKEDIIKRLRRIEGQVKGIQKMVEKGEDCSDILIQIAAVRAAINKVGGLILENYSKSCILKAAKQELDNEKEIQDLIDVILKFMK